jgi:urease subunit alpha
VEAALERIHPASMAAEGPLHDLGAISIVNSDSQGMGRIGETIRRTWQLAHVMKTWAGDNSEEDNARVLRYLAKYTLEPAQVHGILEEVGAVASGRMADVVLWHPSRFGVKPDLVIKAGHVAWGALGEGNASIEGAEPIRYGAHWGALGGAPSALATTFVSQLALDEGIRDHVGSQRRFVAVKDTRGVSRASLAHNTAVLPVEVDPGNGTVTLDGRVLAVEPVSEVPLNRRYLLG